jgi:hypothetical protein
MYPEFRNLVAEALGLQEQLLDLHARMQRMQGGEPTDSGEIASHDLQERLDALYTRIGHEVPAELIDPSGDKPAYLFTGGSVPVEPRDKSGEQFVRWLLAHPQDLDAFVRTLEAP